MQVVTPTGATRGSVKLGQLNQLGTPITAAVSPDGSIASVLSGPFGSSGSNPKGFYATYLSIVQLKPSIKVTYRNGCAMRGFVVRHCSCARGGVHVPP